MQNHYSNLNVPVDAPLSTIRKSYLKLALTWHPDKHPASAKAHVNAKFLTIQDAWEVLRDAGSREKYDRRLMKEYPELFGEEPIPVPTPKKPKFRSFFRRPEEDAEEERDRRGRKARQRRGKPWTAELRQRDEAVAAVRVTEQACMALGRDIRTAVDALTEQLDRRAVHRHEEVHARTMIRRVRNCEKLVEALVVEVAGLRDRMCRDINALDEELTEEAYEALKRFLGDFWEQKGEAKKVKAALKRVERKFESI